MENRTSVGIKLKEGEPDFITWFATTYPVSAKYLFKKYLEYIALRRNTNRGETDRTQSAP